MPFSEKQKLEVKRKAHYKCCICEAFDFLHVHHILPEGEGGPSILENAAPLCTKCHDTYGDNPTKRKWIKEKRDFWYDLCEKKLFSEDINKLEELSKLIEKRLSNQKKKSNKMDVRVSRLVSFAKDNFAKTSWGKTFGDYDSNNQPNKAAIVIKNIFEHATEKEYPIIFATIKEMYPELPQRNLEKLKDIFKLFELEYDQI